MTYDARSWCIARGKFSATGQWIVYTVPANQVLLLKSVSAWGANNSAPALRIYATISDRSVYVQLATISTDAQGSGTWSGWHVLNAGYHLELAAVVANTYYWASGAILTANAPEPIQGATPVLASRYDMPATKPVKRK